MIIQSKKTTFAYLLPVGELRAVTRCIQVGIERTCYVRSQRVPWTFPFAAAKATFEVAHGAS